MIAKTCTMNLSRDRIMNDKRQPSKYKLWIGLDDAYQFDREMPMSGDVR
jgi:hypothetical protein